MEITEVRVTLKESEDKKLKAFATITFDNAFVVRDLKVIEGKKGLFVAMPSRKVTYPCTKCGHRNASKDKFCANCGSKIIPRREEKFDDEGRQNEHRDIAHPITPESREYIQSRVIDAYKEELQRTGENQSAQAARGSDY
ncbi:MAG: septation protein SpoVG family protein [Candidatus Aureabacteria bacterium]|nr:septation protein SpoVG family protein [Candidatus Auribacterota bacterium]